MPISQLLSAGDEMSL